MEMNLKEIIKNALADYINDDVMKKEITQNIFDALKIPIGNNGEIKFFDGFKNKPRLSKESSFVSEDVYIVDEDNMIGVGCFDFEDNKWKFHTDTLVDYFEVGDETQFYWFYPPFELANLKENTK